MKKRTRIIASSIASISLCASLVAGSTFALFTSESKVNIAITSGKVDVTASVLNADLYRPQAIDVNTYAVTYATDENGDELATQSIETDGKTVSLENLLPGDKIKLGLGISSQSTVNYLYRVGVVMTDGAKDFYENLLVGIDGVYYSEYVSGWESSDNVIPDEAGNIITASVEITLPAYLGNKYAGKNCALSFNVEAVQGNAVVSNDSAVKKVYPVYSQDELDGVLGAGLGEDDTIVVMQKWDNVTFETADELDFNVKGCNLDDVIVLAPESSIDYYVAITDSINVEAIAPDSLHVYGKINSLNLKQGRVVVEEAAAVEKATVAPAAEKAATLKILENAVAKEIKVESEGSVTIENEGTIGNLNTENNSNVLVDSTGTIEGTVGDVDLLTHVSTWDELKAAVANGGYIALEEDITTSEIIEVIKHTYINGNGHSIVSSASRILWIPVCDLEVSLTNLKLLRNGNNNVERGVQVNAGVTGIKLNIDSCTIEASAYAVNICGNAEADLTVTNSEITGWGAINAWSASYIHINDSILRGINDKGYNAAGWNNFGTVVIEGDTTYRTEEAAESVDVELVNCTIIAESKTGNIQRCILFNAQSKSNRVNVIDCELVLENENCVEVVDNGTDNVLQVYNTKTQTTTVYTENGFIAALENGGNIRLAADIDITILGKTVIANKDNTVIDLNGHTIYTFNVGFLIRGENVTIKNGNICRNEGKEFSYGLKINGVNAVVENVTITSGINVSGYNPDDSVKEGVSATIKNCRIELDSEWAYYAVCAQGEATVSVENCTIIRTNAGKANNYFWVEAEFTDELGYVGNSSITVSGCMFESTCGTTYYNKGGVAPTFDFDIEE